MHIKMKGGRGGQAWFMPSAETRQWLVSNAAVTTTAITFTTSWKGDEYKVILHPAPRLGNWWWGAWKHIGTPRHGDVECKVFSTKNGDLLLAGSWVEDGVEENMFIEVMA